jgi:hypothetical protein
MGRDYASARELKRRITQGDAASSDTAGMISVSAKVTIRPEK